MWAKGHTSWAGLRGRAWAQISATLVHSESAHLDLFPREHFQSDRAAQGVGRENIWF